MHFLSEYSPPGRVWAEFGSKILLSLSRPISSYLIPFWLKITPESCFLIFLLFFFFRNFLPRVEYERNSGLKFFSLFLGLSHPDLAKYNEKTLFCNFLKVFAIFFSEFAPPGRVWAEFGSKILLSPSRPIASYLILFWLKIKPESCFLIFKIFLLFFFWNFLPGSSMSWIQV